MSKKRKKQRQETKAVTPAGRGFLWAGLAIGIVALALLGLWSSRTRDTNQGLAAEQSGTNALAAASQSGSIFQKLIGKWIRPDGGYIIEIKSADANGKLDAGYFNPNPIHVARAEASGQGSLIKVVIELRDVNYPGSTYTLAYDPAEDQLKGIYFQALEQQQYEIFFQRVK